MIKLSECTTEYDVNGVNMPVVYMTTLLNRLRHEYKVDVDINDVNRFSDAIREHVIYDVAFNGPSAWMTVNDYTDYYNILNNLVHVSNSGAKLAVLFENQYHDDDVDYTSMSYDHLLDGIRI